MDDECNAPVGEDVGRVKPNADTVDAMREADFVSSNPGAKSFNSVEELFEDLDR